MASSSALGFFDLQTHTAYTLRDNNLSLHTKKPKSVDILCPPLAYFTHLLLEVAQESLHNPNLSSLLFALAYQKSALNEPPYSYELYFTQRPHLFDEQKSICECFFYHKIQCMQDFAPLPKAHIVTSDIFLPCALSVFGVHSPFVVWIESFLCYFDNGILKEALPCALQEQEAQNKTESSSNPLLTLINTHIAYLQEAYNQHFTQLYYFGEKKFRVQVANPPYSANWSADSKFLEDERFNEYGKLAPKSKADFAFVQHMVYHMDEDGRAVVLLPHGVLFRGAAEEVIRKYLIQKMNVLDAVIGLPANLFFGTGIPVCVLVLKRERNGNSDNIFFIDASKEFEAGKNQNILRECDIDKIASAYEARIDIDKFAHVATMQEIEENGFNLNIPRYVDTFEPEEEIDLNEVAAEIRKLQGEIKDIDAQLKPYFDELGLDFPFDVEGR